MDSPHQPTTPTGSAAPSASAAWDASAVAAALSEGRVRGVRVWLSTPPAEVIANGAAQAGWRSVNLDTSGVRAKADYIAACADQIPLPDYLGRNWDALEESLGDLGVDSQVKGDSGLLVVWRNWVEFAGAEPANFQVALAIWRSVSGDWRERLEGGAVVLAVDSLEVPAALPESVADEITGISRVRGN